MSMSIEPDPINPCCEKHEEMPDDRPGENHKFDITGYRGYITANTYPDGRPGEIFIDMSKQGSTISGLIHTIAQLISIGLQHGVPLECYARKLVDMQFEPQGVTNNQEIQVAKSITDYVFRWLRLKFDPPEKDETKES
jgi:ribonucleoside-diphosphate reductase alpha chain